MILLSIKKYLRRKLHGGALYYALFIAFLIAMVCTVFIMGSYLHHSFILQYTQNEKLIRNLRSAEVLINGDPGLVGLNETKDIKLFDNNEDIVNVERHAWGIFQLVKLTSSWKNLQKTTLLLTGSDNSENKPVALYLADRQRYLSVSGKSLLRGDCYLPALGIRRAYIEGKSFMGTSLIYGLSNKSSSILPDLDLKQIESEMHALKGNFSNRDSVYSAEIYLSNTEHRQSFYNATHLLYSENWINLSNHKLEGNIKIVSTRGISVESSAVLNGVILLAPKVFFNKGFKGSVQVFATDSISTGNQCTFFSPSALVMVSRTDSAYIELGTDNLLKGDIIQTPSVVGTRLKTEVKIATDSRVEGTVYVNGNVDLRGSVYGSLYCMGFILRTPGALYENHMLDAVVDYTALSQYYSGAAFFPSKTKTKTIRHVY